MFFSIILILILQILVSFGQDYQVADIRCEFPNEYDSKLPSGEFSAKLKKPPGFLGHPLFADDRYINPERDPHCQIMRDPQDRAGHIYMLYISDLTQCGVTKKDGYVNVRIWFPQLNGVVLATDQEVIIMCKPASPTIIENRAAGFAGSLPSVGRVTGVVEESPGRLEYEVVLLREAQARSNHEKLVDQAVPIGSKLQLRARINTQSSWKFAKLMEVTVSSDSLNPHPPGHVVLVQNGCRKADFKSIVPKQPRRSSKNPGEVVLEFQAFMLDSKNEGSSQLWIHATIKACVLEEDCGPETCLDLHEPNGLGKRRKKRSGIPLEIVPALRHRNSSNIVAEDLNSEEIDYFPFDQNLKNLSSIEEAIERLKKLQEIQNKRKKTQGIFTEVGDNVGLEVIFPQKFFSHTKILSDTCNAFLVLSTCLGLGLFMAVGFLCFLTAKLQRTVKNTRNKTLDSVIRDHHTKYGVRDFKQPPFQ